MLDMKTEFELCQVEGGKVKLLAAPVVGGCGYILLVPWKQRADGASWQQRCAKWDRNSMEQHEVGVQSALEKQSYVYKSADSNSWPARIR